MYEEIKLHDSSSIENKIFQIRGVPVMLDSDLAQLYEIETKVLNQSVSRNKERFPEHFAFQLSSNEWENLRSHFVTSKQKHGGRRYLPFAFTEQGVAMLSAILKSTTAIRISIQIMSAFVSMRKYEHLLKNIPFRVQQLEKKQFEFDQKIDKVFTALEKADSIPKQGIFFNGQIFDAYKFAADIIKSAKKSIILIDNYIDESTLALLSKRDKKVEAFIYSENANQILKNDLSKFEQQYHPVTFHTLKNNHDRFLIIDKKEMYHIGASLKDLGKKLFAFSKMDAETKRMLEVIRV